MYIKPDQDGGGQIQAKIKQYCLNQHIYIISVVKWDFRQIYTFLTLIKMQNIADGIFVRQNDSRRIGLQQTLVLLVK